MLDNLSSLSEFDAQRIIDSLRVGTVPTDQLKTLTVGRDDILTALRDDLDFIAAGGSKVRLISASYGGGKTHLLGLLSHAALNSNFLVSHVQLHAREAPFDQFEVIFSVLIRNSRSGSLGAGAPYRLPTDSPASERQALSEGAEAGGDVIRQGRQAVSL